MALPPRRPCMASTNTPSWRVSTWKWRPNSTPAPRPPRSSARDIKRFKRNGESWVRFYLAIDTAHSHPIERPLARVSKIKRRAGDYDPDEDKNYTARPVIALDICMGSALRSIEVNLTDRSAFQYPLLIGSEALKRFDALVDPSLKYAAGKPACAADAHTAE